MSIKLLTLDKERDYFSIHDTATKKDRTTFILGALDSRVAGKIMDSGSRIVVDTSRPSDEVETSIDQNEVSFTTVQFGLRGWRNLTDADGNEIPFATVNRRMMGKSYKIVDPVVLERLPTIIMRELAEEIMSVNTVSDSDGKK